MSTPNIVCVCPYCKTGYEWWVNCDCLLLEEEQEQQQQQQQQQEQQQEDDDDLVTCGNCGNRWDGYAQCNCWGYMMDDNYENDNYENDTHNQLNLAEATTVRQQH